MTTRCAGCARRLATRSSRRALSSPLRSALFVANDTPESGAGTETIRPSPACGSVTPEGCCCASRSACAASWAAYCALTSASCWARAASTEFAWAFSASTLAWRALSSACCLSSSACSARSGAAAWVECEAHAVTRSAASAGAIVWLSFMWFSSLLLSPTRSQRRAKSRGGEPRRNPQLSIAGRACTDRPRERPWEHTITSSWPQGSRDALATREGARGLELDQPRDLHARPPRQL